MSFPKFQRTAVTDAGDVIPGATVTVRDQTTGLTSNIFSDRAGSVPKSNPFNTGNDGFVEFYASNGEYRIEVSGGAGSIEWGYVPLVGAAALLDTGVGSGEIPTADDLESGAFTTVGTAATKDAGTASEELATNAHVAKQVHAGQSMTYGGTADAITLTSVNTVALTALKEGDVFRFDATAANTGAVTFIVDDIGSPLAGVDIEGNVLTAGYIRNDGETIVRYDLANTRFIVGIAARDQYHTTNLNPNVFGSGANTLVAVGEVFSSTLAVVYLACSLPDAPNSISVPSTYKIEVLTGTGTLVLGSGLDVGDISLSSNSSGKLAQINVSIPSTGSRGQVRLIGETATSKVTVNP